MFKLASSHASFCFAKYILTCTGELCRSLFPHNSPQTHGKRYPAPSCDFKLLPLYAKSTNVDVHTDNAVEINPVSWLTDGSAYLKAVSAVPAYTQLGAGGSELGRGEFLRREFTALCRDRIRKWMIIWANLWQIFVTGPLELWGSLIFTLFLVLFKKKKKIVQSAQHKTTLQPKSWHQENVMGFQADTYRHVPKIKHSTNMSLEIFNIMHNQPMLARSISSSLLFVLFLVVS